MFLKSQRYDSALKWKVILCVENHGNNIGTLLISVLPTFLQRNSKMLYRTYEGKDPQGDEAVLYFCQQDTCKTVAFLHAKWWQSEAGEIAKIPRIDLTKFKAERGSYDHIMERIAIKTSKVLSKAACWY